MYRVCNLCECVNIYIHSYVPYLIVYEHSEKNYQKTDYELIRVI